MFRVHVVLAKFLTVFMLLFNVSAAAADLVFVKQNSEPKYLPDGNGLCDQIYSLLSVHLKVESITVEMDPNFYPIKRILMMLDNKNANVFCGAGFNDERSKKYVYSSLPAYNVSNVILAHEDEQMIPKSFEDIVNHQLVIGSYYGSSSSTWLQKQKGVLVSENHHDLNKITKYIAAPNGLRYFFYHDLALNHYVKESNLPVKVLPVAFRTYSHWLMYSQHTSKELIDALELAMKSITESGELQTIRDRFLISAQ